MTVMQQGKYNLDISLKKISLGQDSRAAWELFTELATRVGVTGKADHPTDFSGEVYAESLASLHAFIGEVRKILRQYPGGSISSCLGRGDHLGGLMLRMLRDVLRPFLEEWQASYRHWWENASDTSQPPFERQLAYPHRQEMLADWSDVRAIMQAVQNLLEKKYALLDSPYLWGE